MEMRTRTCLSRRCFEIICIQIVVDGKVDSKQDRVKVKKPRNTLAKFLVRSQLTLEEDRIDLIHCSTPRISTRITRRVFVPGFLAQSAKGKFRASMERRCNPRVPTCSFLNRVQPDDGTPRLHALVDRELRSCSMESSVHTIYCSQCRTHRDYTVF